MFPEKTKQCLSRFRMKSDEITGSGTYQMLGKMDEQYGIQLKSSSVLVYACDAKGSWVESSCAIDSGFWNKWHDILVVFTGTKMQIYVDGKPEHQHPEEQMQAMITK